MPRACTAGYSWCVKKLCMKLLLVEKTTLTASFPATVFGDWMAASKGCSLAGDEGKGCSAWGMASTMEGKGCSAFSIKSLMEGKG